MMGKTRSERVLTLSSRGGLRTLLTLSDSARPTGEAELGWLLLRLAQVGARHQRARFKKAALEQTV